MSLDATRWAWQQNISSTEKLFLLSLADRADENHICYPSFERIANDTGMNQKTVRKCASSLKELGLIEIFSQQGKPNFFRLIGVENRHTTPTKIGTPTVFGTPTKIGRNPSQKRHSTPTKIGTRIYYESIINLKKDSKKTVDNFNHKKNQENLAELKKSHPQLFTRKREDMP